MNCHEIAWNEMKHKQNNVNWKQVEWNETNEMAWNEIQQHEMDWNETDESGVKKQNQYTKKNIEWSETNDTEKMNKCKEKNYTCTLKTTWTGTA